MRLFLTIDLPGDAKQMIAIQERTLFESHLTPTGARYRAVSAYPFGRKAP